MFRRFFRKRYRPDWEDGGFIRGLAPTTSWRSCLAGISSAETLARFFRDRESPRFFADPSQIREAVLRARRERPEWSQGAIDVVREQTTSGLGIYARTGPPLASGFPWEGVDAGASADKLYRKRPHRFGFAPRLALAALYGERTDQLLGVLLSEWMRFASSRDNGLAYDSNLTVIQRLLALSWAWAFLAARESPTAEGFFQEALVLKVIRSDIEFLGPRLGDSFPNNHLLADLFAGWFIGCVWPELARGTDLRGRFEPLWLRELERQTLADGASFEHSTHYHEYACEMAVAYLILNRRNGWETPGFVLTRVSRMLEFQAHLAGPEGVTLAIGDAAEDPLFPLDSGDGWGTAAWRVLQRALFPSRLSPPSAHPPSEERAFWLLGGASIEPDAEDEPAALYPFPHGGFYVFHDAPSRSRLVFRTGPVKGESVSAGHTHSDLLSVLYVADGRPLIVDAGTLTYRTGRSSVRGQADWRRYLRGPSAHNGLDIDGVDALGQVSKSFRAPSIETFVSVGIARAEAAAAMVDAKVVGNGPYGGHRRGVVRVWGEYSVVYDVLPTAVAGARVLGFQFSPGAELEPFGMRGVSFASGVRRHILVGSSNLAKPARLVGSLEPLGGWVSPRYGELTPAPQVRFAVERDSATAAFLLRPADPQGAVEMEIREMGTHGVRVRVSTGDVEDVLLVNFGADEDLLATEGVEFRGRMAWIRCLKGKPTRLRWLDGCLFRWSSRGVAVESPESRSSLDLEPHEPQGAPDARALSVIWPVDP